MIALQTIALVAVTAMAGFLALFFVARRVQNFGWVDVAWSGGFAPVAVFYAMRGGGDPVHRALIAGMMSAWSLRLALMLGRRVWSHHPKEDGRYTQLRREWRTSLDLKMSGFYLLQALLLVLLSAPVALAVERRGEGLTSLDIVALGVWIIALTGETIADAQLAAFKRDPANAGRVCDRGLWRWSRHPNYFFEWLVWIAFALAITPAPVGWVAWVCPLLMAYFLLCVTGVRYTEEQLLRSKGAAYREYQRRTSAFLPLPPRAATSQ